MGECYLNYVFKLIYEELNKWDEFCEHLIFSKDSEYDILSDISEMDIDTTSISLCDDFNKNEFEEDEDYVIL